MDAEIVLIIGYNASGKSTIVKEFVSDGYHRVNRDESGGTLAGQTQLARKFITNGHKKIVLDNTYPTIESRKSIIELGKELKVPVRCVWLTTSFEDAQFNACFRMMEKCGRILMPQDFENAKDPNLFPPVALFNYRSQFENTDKKQKPAGKQEPKVEHGFHKVEKRVFVRNWGSEYVNQALILDFDNNLRRSKGAKDWPEDPSEVEILPGRREKLLEYQKNGYMLLGASNQSAIAKGLPVAKAIACFDRTCELLGVKIDYQFCPHNVPPVKCYCRKPQCGIGVYFIHKYKLLPSKCIFVGDQTSDKTFAERCGFKYFHTGDFFR